MNTKRETMYKNIEKHGRDLITLFGLRDTDPVKLCKQLFRLERKAHYATSCLCNTNTLNLMELNRFTGYDVKQATEGERDVFFAGIRKSLERIIGKENAAYCFINFDPRGYALKIKAEACKEFPMYKDWGGYGILAPDFR